VKWLRHIFEDEEDREWYREHPERNPDAPYYAIAPALGALSLSFSLGWSWRGFAGAAICVLFLGFPASIAAIHFWGKAADDHWGDKARLRLWEWSGWVLAILAIFVWHRLFLPD
jgi:hypothetical protein